MKGKRMSALATASLMAMTALAAMPQPAMADEEKTVINIWSKDRHDADYVQKKVDEYNATNTDNIEVNYQLYTDNYQQAIDMAVQSGELPDILVFQDDAFNKYLGEGQWADLYEFMDEFNLILLFYGNYIIVNWLSTVMHFHFYIRIFLFHFFCDLVGRIFVHFLAIVDA